MIRRPPRSTQSRSSAASDVYKRQACEDGGKGIRPPVLERVQSPDVGVFDRRFNHEQVVIAELAQALRHVGELVDQLGARRRVPMGKVRDLSKVCLLYTSPSPRD